GQDQGEDPGRRTRRGRDDPHHLGVHQGQADPALPRHRPEVLRPRHRVPRPDGRPGDRGFRQRHQAVRRRREVRDHHAGRGAGEGVRAEAHVAQPQRHHPQHPGRHHLPRAHHLLQRAAPGAALVQADRGRPPRLRRHLPRGRDEDLRPRQADAPVPARRRRRARGAGGVQLPRRRRGDGHAQHPRLHRGLRARLLQLRPGPQLSRVPVHQEHDPQGLRRHVQGRVPAHLRRRLQSRVREARPGLRAPPDRRHGGRRAEVGRRIRLGLQELRRRRAERHRGPGLRLARPDDLRAALARRQHGGVGGGARHRHPPLPRAPERPRNQHQSHRLHLRLDARARLPRPIRWHAGRHRLRRHAGAGLHRDGGERRHDQGPRRPDQQGPALAQHPGLPGEDRREPAEGDAL
ncbi:MAG: Isocitrate dehydrogenase [NADP], partial [uncultured Acetobacteraceae bacterium]